MIRAIRKDKGLTQKALALKARMSITYLCNVELDKVDPSLSTLRRLAKALKVKVADLVDE
jgi:transcriptional regulator with XRE-family HTH domain